SDSGSSEVKDLVPLGWFSEKHDNRLFDYILENIDFIVDDLEERNRILSLGLISAGGGNYKGKIRSTGDFRAQDDVLCRGISIIGKSKFKGILIVDGVTMIVGRSKFLDHCIFGGKVDIAGNAFFDTHILTSGELKLGGKVTVKGNIYADSPIILNGTTKMKNIRSTSSVIAKAAIFVEEDLFADEFVLSKGGGEIGSITARYVTVGFKDRAVAKRYKGVGEKRNLINPVKLIKHTNSSIWHMISRHPGGSKILQVHGNIHAEEVYLSNCVVHGDIKATNVIIGPDVTVTGMIEYSETLKFTEDTETTYRTKQIEAEKE
ncbi:MAG: hypothetical protein HeimC2_39830, partial [Candidatus Heimdallarchaeota archaeon LC_2]